jgi:hypothetical protein
MSQETTLIVLFWLVVISFGIRRFVAKATAAANSNIGKQVAGAGIKYALHRLLK